MKRKKCQVTRRKELFYYVASGSNVVRDVHWCVTVDYLKIRLRARVFYEQIVNEAQPSWLSLVENEGE